MPSCFIQAAIQIFLDALQCQDLEQPICPLEPISLSTGYDLVRILFVFL